MQEEPQQIHREPVGCDQDLIRRVEAEFPWPNREPPAELAEEAFVTGPVPDLLASFSLTNGVIGLNTYSHAF